MGVIVGFGELMLRLSPNGYERLFQNQVLMATFGGGEANVCVSCARFGIKSRYVSGFPINAIGKKANELLLGQNVDTSSIFWNEGRMGIYFVEKGANQRGGSVLYDRANSVISLSQASDYNWNNIFKDASWLHVSGITPAISENAASLTIYAVKQAKKHGVNVSCDLNYRKNLWKYGKESLEVMPEIVKHSDLLIANEEDIQLSLGIKAEIDVTREKMDTSKYESLMRKVISLYPNLKIIATTLRESVSANHNNWSAVCLSDNNFYNSKRYQITHIVDRVGGGDSFAGGFLSAMQMYSNDISESLEFAVAASCLKHSVEGDWNFVSKEDVLSLLDGDGSGRVKR